MQSAARVRAESKPLSFFGQQKMLVRKKPKDLTTYFKMGSDINLSKAQVEMFAYVFDPDLLPSEKIIEIRDSFLTRQEVFCLSKDRTISDKIFEFWAKKCTWDQNSITLKTTWCLPPSFSAHVSEFLQMEELIDRYADEYMGKYPSLEYIYVPVKEDNDHWYLLVMCLKLKTTFHLDSNLPAERKESRTAFVENLAVVLSDIITSSHFADCPFEHVDFSGVWSTCTIDVVDNVQPLSKCKDNSAIWVLSWLHMEYSFNPEIPPTISEHQVLVTTTIDLVLGASNKLRRTVMDNASEHWVRLNHP